VKISQKVLKGYFLTHIAEYSFVFQFVRKS